MEAVSVPMGAVGRMEVELLLPSAGLPSVLQELEPVPMGALDETGVGNG